MKELAVKDWLNFYFISTPRFDGTGKNFFVSVKRANYKSNKYSNKICLFKDGKISRFGKDGFSPKWSPKNDKIGFLKTKKSKKGKTFLCVYDIENKDIVEKEIEKDIESFEWYDSESFILLCNEKSKDREDSVFEAAEEIPFFSNAEGFIAGNRKRVYKYKGEKLSLITPKNLNVELVKVFNRKIYFIAQETDKMEKYPMITDVYVMEKGKAKKLTSSDKWIMDFDVRNGMLIYVGSDFEYGLVTSSRLFVTNLKNMETKKYLEESSISLGNSVNSDSRGTTRTLKTTDNKIYCIGTKKDRSVLYVVDYDGNYNIIEKDYSFDDFDVNSKEEILFVKNSDSQLPNLYLLKNGKEKLIKKFNQSKLEFSKPEKFTVKDREIDAWIIKPFNFDKNKKYPAILEIHGGPKTTYGKGFMFEFQLLASLGYVVIYSNPFGSDGYGQEFGDLREKYGTVDYEDLMAVVDSAIDNFKFIDKTRLGVTGGSYGGFMTNWIIGHTDRFKAAVTQRSISNWVSMFGISDIGYFFSRDHVGGTPWGNTEEYVKKSPLTYANNFKTPTLIIHSKNDYRCPVAEGYQLFTALRYNEIDARMVLFEGENHDLSRSGKPKQKTRRLVEIINWFDKYLKVK